MKFAIVSLNNTHRIIEVINMFGLIIDNDEPDFVITYGGDGTVLFAERKYPGIPKITLRGSEGGFKCLYSEFELEDVILKMDGGYDIQEELKLETIFQGRRYLSLNEVQVHNASPIKAIRLSICEDNQILFDNVISDGTVIATPFGSTAYYSSVGGSPFNKGIGIAINNPYKYKYRPIVVDEDSEIQIKILRDNGLLLFDNDDKIIKVKGGDEILVAKSKETAKFVVV